MRFGDQCVLRFSWHYHSRRPRRITSVFDWSNSDAPIGFDLDFGHTWPTTPIPIGGRIKIDPRRETIQFE
nr:hypothetical protein [Natronorubrum daqingense]